jgi:hypothetical protein
MTPFERKDMPYIIGVGVVILLILLASVYLAE